MSWLAKVGSLLFGPVCENILLCTRGVVRGLTPARREMVELLTSWGRKERMGMAFIGCLLDRALSKDE